MWPSRGCARVGGRLQYLLMLIQLAVFLFIATILVSLILFYCCDFLDGYIFPPPALDLASLFVLLEKVLLGRIVCRSLICSLRNGANSVTEANTFNCTIDRKVAQLL